MTLWNDNFAFSVLLAHGLCDLIINKHVLSIIPKTSLYIVFATECIE